MFLVFHNKKPRFDISHIGDTVHEDNYHHVATVDSESINEVYDLTNSIESPWYENTRNIQFHGSHLHGGKGVRSTSVGDILQHGENGPCFLVDSIGFRKITMIKYEPKVSIDFVATKVNHAKSIDFGYDDYDIAGESVKFIYRACLPHAIKKGDIFNVYCDSSVKFGATWNGDLKSSLQELANSDEFKRIFGLHIDATATIIVDGVDIIQGDLTTIQVIYNNITGFNFKNNESWRTLTHQ